MWILILYSDLMVLWMKIGKHHCPVPGISPVNPSEESWYPTWLSIFCSVSVMVSLSVPLVFCWVQELTWSLLPSLLYSGDHFMNSNALLTILHRSYLKLNKLSYWLQPFYSVCFVNLRMPRNSILNLLYSGVFDLHVDFLPLHVRSYCSALMAWFKTVLPWTHQAAWISAAGFCRLCGACLSQKICDLWYKRCIQNSA